MQVDMHYYGTYCLARAAGISVDTSRLIAYSSQFVDDNVAAEVDDHYDGSRLYAVPTAHHPGDISNRADNDQRHIWVPFHFIPGVEGDTFTEQLICRKDSIVAQTMIANHASRGAEPFGPMLLGLGTHVYKDTFAHYGFSGVSSRRNRVDGDSFVLKQEQGVVDAALGRTFGEWIGQYGGLLRNVRSKISGVAEIYSGSLGHGAVSNYPDLPFLQYQFTYEHTGETVYHDNPATFIECAEKIYNIFYRFALENEHHRGTTSVKWEDIEDKIKWIFSHEGGTKWDRADIWKVCSIDGDFGLSEKIPEYDADDWNDQGDHLKDLDYGADGLDLEVHRFHRAASYHVHYVLRELLPAHGLMVV